MEEAAAEVAAAVGKVAERLYAEDYDAAHTEESVAEVMRWLELEIKIAAGAATLPPPPPAAAAVYVTVRGTSEGSCGSSLSAPASTVMASVDGRAVKPPAAAVPWPWPWPFPEAAAAAGAEEEYDEADDEWVSQLLTDGPGEEGPLGTQ